MIFRKQEVKFKKKRKWEIKPGPRKFKFVSQRYEITLTLSCNMITFLLFFTFLVRCEKFVTMCAFHGEYFFSSSNAPPELQCCGTFFNPKPFFVNTGTCFTSNLEIWEVWPFTFSYIKVLLNVDSNLSPGT